MSGADDVIRLATVADFDGIGTLLEACGLPSSDLTVRSLDGFHVAVKDAAIVGVAGIEPVGDVALLRSVAVHHRLRGSGLGSRLFDASLALARARSIGTLYLIPDDESAHRFFARRGFASVDRNNVPEAVRALPEFTHLCPKTHPCLSRFVDTDRSLCE